MTDAPRVSAEEAARLLAEGGYVYLDVRSEPEFEAGHPAGAYNVPIRRLDAAGQLAPNPDFVRVVAAHFAADRPLLVGCAAGERSLEALGALRAAGFTDVVDLRPGLDGRRDPFGRVTEPGWRACGLPLAHAAAPGRRYADLARTL